METIRMYLDNMFAGLPKTAQMSDIKDNILSNMEDKYNELKAAGKSENEAIGIVISEFGNIEELVNELGIKKEVSELTHQTRVITKEETYSYLAVKRSMGIQIAIGVFLCIMGPASLILLTTLIEKGMILTGVSKQTGDLLGLIPLFLLVAVAVAIFIFSGMNFERYKYIEEGVILPDSLKDDIQRKYDKFNRPYYLSVVIGVCLLITSPISVLVAHYLGNNSTNYGVVILLGIVSVAVSIFIYFGMIRESYSRLLKIGDYTVKNEKENKVIGAVASIVWPLAIIIFLYNGFVNDMWSRAWIVFPITALIFGMFSAAYSIITGKNQ